MALLVLGTPCFGSHLSFLAVPMVWFHLLVPSLSGFCNRSSFSLTLRFAVFVVLPDKFLLAAVLLLWISFIVSWVPLSCPLPPSQTVSLYNIPDCPGSHYIRPGRSGTHRDTPGLLFLYFNNHNIFLVMWAWIKRSSRVFHYYSQ